MNATSSALDSIEITKSLKTLYPAGSIIELRIPATKRNGYYDDHQALASKIQELSGTTALYTTLNPFAFKAGIPTERHNKIASASSATKDSDVTRRRWLLIDIDPQRPAGASATDAEKASALDILKAVSTHLTNQGFPPPVSADSGNGYHLLYRLNDLPNTSEVTETVKSVLNHLAERFDTATVKVDTSVYNPARITKAYGTLSCKGENTHERPHRLSKLRVVPDQVVPVTLEQMKKLLPVKSTKASPSLIAKAPKTKSAYAPITSEKVEEFLDFYKKDWSAIVEHTEGQLKWTIDCPWAEEHSDGRPEACVFLKDGVLGFKCQHQHCSGRGWKEFRTHLETTTGSKFWFNDNLTEITPASAPITSTLVLEKVSDIKMEVIHWLWPGRIARGKLNLFCGHPDLGKGMATMDLCARCTTGAAFPDAPNPNEPMSVIIFSSEDAVGDTLKPRLTVAGADLTRCIVVRMLKDQDGSNRVFGLDKDLPALRHALEQNPDVGLVVIDPVMNHCGAVNAYKDQELRRILTPLGTLAEEFKVAVVIVAHLNKQQGGELITRIGGGMAIVGCSRIAWMFTESKEHEGTRLMSMIKGNITKATGGMSYEIEGVPLDIFDEEKKEMVPSDIGRINWCGVTKEKLTAEHIGFNTKKPGMGAQCEAWLAHYMKSGKEYLSSEVTALGKDLGYNEKMVKRSYDKLGGLASVKKSDGWYWQFPPVGLEPSQGAFVGGE